ncbi:MAG: PAS domain S-box protein [Candidatus Brocadiaceae bacterium]|nr:PAS domain S-box protein [Candidatus Brocadiaceae bacterium]
MGKKITHQNMPHHKPENDTVEALKKKNEKLQAELARHMKTEEELRKLSRAIEQSPGTVTITDANGIIEYVNPKFTELTGYTPEEAIGQNPRILKPDHIPSEEYKELWKTISSGKEWHGEFCNKKKNGEFYWEFASISPVKDRNGVITHYIAVKEDITERKRAEEELRKLSHAIEQSPVTVTITDIKGNIEYVNPKFTELTGYTQEEVIGKNPSILKSDTMPSDTYREVWETITSGKEWRGEFCNKKKNGELYWEFASISPVKNQKGEITHFIAVKEDITERKKAEEERNRHLQELEDIMSYSTIMNEEVEEEALFQHMATALQERFNPDIIAVIMLDKEKNMLYLPFITPSIPISEFIKDEVIHYPSLCRVMKTGEAHSVDDINKEPVCECILHKAERGGYLCFPLKTGDTTIGSVIMQKKDIYCWKDEKTRKLISNYIGLTALALQRLELLDIAKHTTITDDLTGVYNRRFFNEILGKHISLAKRRNEQLTLLIANVDHFHYLTDTYGHTTGDRLLQQLARALSDYAGNSDIIARFGDEEFAIIMPNMFITRALVKADGIRQQIENTDFKDIVPEQILNVTISMGAASYPEHSTEREMLIKLAYEALCKARKEGSNRLATP